MSKHRPTCLCFGCRKNPSYLLREVRARLERGSGLDDISKECQVTKVYVEDVALAFQIEAGTTATLPVVLEVRDKDGDLVQRKELDFLSKADRVNIAKTAWWAMHEGYELRTRPV